MQYPWIDKFVMQAAPAEDIPPDEDTGTNEPVDVPADDNPDEQPNPDLAQDIVDTPPDAGTDTTDTTDTAEGAPVDDLQSEIDDLKKQLEDLKSDYDMQDEIDELKRRIDNLQVPDDADMNDSLFQSASAEIKYLKRACRRIKNSGLSGSQRNLINLKFEQHPTMSNQEIAADMAKVLGAREQDIFDYIMNTEFRFRHRHGPRASIIDWDSI